MMAHLSPRWMASCCVLLIGLLAGQARAVWFDEAWPYRRGVNVTWDAEHATGREIAAVTIYTAGHHREDGKDMRVLTHDGRAVAFEVLRVGPGDRVDVVFSLHKGTKDYFVYFGNDKAGGMPKDAPRFEPTAGMMFETRRWNRQDSNNFQQIERSFEKSEPVLGKAMIDRPYIGYNPASDEQQTISKLTGSLFAPIDGKYFFAVAGDDKAGLWIDGKEVAFAQWAAGDARFSGTIDLKRGQHDVVIYHVDHGGEWRLSVGWRRPDMDKIEIPDRGAWGFVFGGQIGDLEQTGKRLVADFKPEYLGECYFDNDYAHRYRLTAPQIKGAEYEWDFGDGQTGKGQRVEHVYLSGGVFPIKLTAKLGANSDTQTTGLHVARDLSQLDKMKIIDLASMSKSIKGYDLGKASSSQLARMAVLHRIGEDRDAMLAAIGALVKIKKHADPQAVMVALADATHDAVTHGKAEEATGLLAKVPRDSNIQPKAAELLGDYLIWWMVDPKRAAEALEPFEGKSEDAKRLRGQALVLAGEGKKGRALLESLPVEVDAQKRPALSGAMARTVEFFITEKDWEAGEDQWWDWMRRFPADFVEGYSVLLRAKLMELRGAKKEAAKVAEAFATAVPDSSYAPRLLNLASELLKESDKAKSDAIRAILKERYPEDPLSQ